MSYHKVTSATGSQMEKLEQLMAIFLEKNPHVGIVETHPEVKHMPEYFQTVTHHDYIKESLGNYLEQTIEEVKETELPDDEVIKGLLVGFLDGMPEIKSDNTAKLQAIFSQGIKGDTAP